MNINYRQHRGRPRVSSRLERGWLGRHAYGRSKANRQWCVATTGLTRAGAWLAGSGVWLARAVRGRSSVTHDQQGVTTIRPGTAACGHDTRHD
jgi:hypothetical protein